MRIKGLFWILTALLLSVLAIITYHAFYTESVSLFFLVEGLVLLTVLYLSVFYRRIIKPLHIIGNGMELLKEQDFSSRLSRVGQKEADRIVDIFNKMMEQLKNERLHLREQNHFLDLLINASPMGVIMLNLDKEVLSVNPAARKMLGISSLPDIVGKRLSELDSPLAAELEPIPLYDSQTVRLNDANIYKCTHSCKCTVKDTAFIFIVCKFQVFAVLCYNFGIVFCSHGCVSFFTQFVCVRILCE